MFESSTLSERKLSDIIKQYAVEISKQPAADRPRMYVSSVLGGTAMFGPINRGYPLSTSPLVNQQVYFWSGAV